MKQVSVKEMNIHFAWFMLGYIGLSLVVGTYLPADMPYWMTACISELVIMFPIIVVMIARKIYPKSFVMLERIGLDDIVLTYVGAYSLFPLIYLINFTTMFFAKNYVGGMMLDVYEYPFWLQLLLMAVFPAVVEEFIFRGFFYSNYRKKGIWKAALLSGLFFGIAHMNLNQFAYAFVIGVAFCALYEATGNIFIPMVAHFAINANSVMLLQFQDIASELESEASAQAAVDILPMGMIVIMFGMLFGLSALFTALFVSIVKKMAKKHERIDNFRKNAVNEDETKEPVVDVCLILTTLFSISYMIVIEML